MKFISAAALLLLTACNFALPAISSALVEQNLSGNTIFDTDLNQSQINALSHWFSLHSSGWSSSVISYAPALVVRVKHSNGDVSIVNLIGQSVVVYNNSGQFVRKFAEPDLAALRNILGVR